MDPLVSSFIDDHPAVGRVIVSRDDLLQFVSRNVIEDEAARSVQRRVRFVE